MKYKFFLFFSIFFLILPINSFAFKIVDPSDNYKVIETDNFNFYYPPRLKSTAYYFANLSESIEKELTKTLKLKNYEKTHVVLLDYSDNLDGLSTNLPYNRIYLNLTQPDIFSTVGEFNNYLLNLFVHEYLHILLLDAQKGFSETTRSIFGKPAIPFENPTALPFFLVIAPPNIFLPPWYHEGFSTFGETYFTGKGRGNFSLIDSYFRASIKDNKLLKIDEINGDIGRYPYGHAPYWWGQKVFEYIEKKYGIEKIGELIEDHSSRFPYFINAVPLRKFNKNYLEIYNSAITEELDRQKRNIDILTSSSLTVFEPLSLNYESINSFAFSGDNKLLAIDAFDPHSGNRLVVYKLPNYEKVLDIKKQPSCGSLIFSKDSKKIYFTQLIFKDITKRQQDIFELNLEDKNIKKLTTNLRVKDLSYDEHNDVFIGIQRESIVENLVILDKNFSVEKLTDYKESYLLSHPSLSRDNEKIVYIKKELKGTYFITLYNRKNKNIVEIYKSNEQLAFPFFSEDSKKILFVTDRSGVFNLAEIDLDKGDVNILTNHFYGILKPIYKEDFLYFLYPKSSGYGLGRTKKASIYPQTPAVINKISYPNRLEIKESNKEFIEKSYSPTETLMPRFFLPNIFSDHEGTVLGIFTANQDVLGKHTYFLEIAYGLLSFDLYYKLSYVNESYKPSIKLLSYSQPVLYYNFYRIADFWERESALDLFFDFKLPLPKSPKLKLGLHLEDKSPLSELYNSSFFGIPIFKGQKNYLYLTFSYGRLTKAPLSLGLESGYKLELTYNKYLDLLGSDIKGYELLLSLDKYFQIGEIVNHRTFYLDFNVGYSKETKTAQNAFSLGGIPSITNPFYLRGYPHNFLTGSYISTLTFEYKNPLSYIFRGPDTKPIFLEKLYNVIFTDMGNVWSDHSSFKFNEIRQSIGLEIRADATIGYWAKITPILGIARGLNKDGATQLYFNIISNF